MCAVSAITDYYRTKWPVPIIQPWAYEVGAAPFLEPKITITQAQWNEYMELKRRMEEYDRLTGQPDCVKPDVAAWEQAVKQLIIKD